MMDEPSSDSSRKLLMLLNMMYFTYMLLLYDVDQNSFNYNKNITICLDVFFHVCNVLLSTKYCIFIRSILKGRNK